MRKVQTHLIFIYFVWNVVFIPRYIVKGAQDDISLKTIRKWLRNAVERETEKYKQRKRKKLKKFSVKMIQLKFKIVQDRCWTRNWDKRTLRYKIPVKIPRRIVRHKKANKNIKKIFFLQKRYITKQNRKRRRMRIRRRVKERYVKKNRYNLKKGWYRDIA